MIKNMHIDYFSRNTIILTIINKNNIAQSSSLIPNGVPKCWNICKKGMKSHWITEDNPNQSMTPLFKKIC
jgi:hypothetical protein